MRNLLMQSLVIFGSAIGFLIGMVTGLLNENSWSTIIWRSCIAACVAGTMFRWWARSAVRNLKQAQEERIAASPDELAIPQTRSN
ncbi:MAG: hypothetical protein ACI9OD_004669 [Limisphaerales bacterium]|jgi:hypothetical protein